MYLYIYGIFNIDLSAANNYFVATTKERIVYIDMNKVGIKMQ